MPSSATQPPLTDANRLGLDYAAEAQKFTYTGPIIDAHMHLFDVHGARVFFEAADAFGVDHVITQTPFEHVQPIRDEFGDRVHFVAIPQYFTDDPETAFTTDWLKRLEWFYEDGSRMFKIWAGPRGLDRSPHLAVDSPIRLEAMEFAKKLGYNAFMTHVGDPDTWYTTMYADSHKYGTKQKHMDALWKLLEKYPDTPWLGAHMGGYPEDLDLVSKFLDRFPNYVLDTSACKWMVRELSKHINEFADLVRAYPGRILWGTDIVAHKLNALPPEEARAMPKQADRPPIEIKDDAGFGFDLYASRFWAMRSLVETNYAGPSPIVDPDLHMVDQSVDPKATADLNGANFDEATLKMLYHDNAAAFIEKVWG